LVLLVLLILLRVALLVPFLVPFLVPLLVPFLVPWLRRVPLPVPLRLDLRFFVLSSSSHVTSPLVPFSVITSLPSFFLNTNSLVGSCINTPGVFFSLWRVFAVGTTSIAGSCVVVTPSYAPFGNS
jgi:hypothetical protein